MSMSQVIPYHVKLITETNHMHREERKKKKVVFMFTPVLFSKMTFKMHQK